MMVWLTSHGYLYLFLLSFLASSLVPIGSEWLLAVLLVKAMNPYYLLFSATVGNVLGALSTYWVGLYAGNRLVKRVFHVKPESNEKAYRVFMKYGVWSLFFSWLPVIGDGLCLVGGTLKVPMRVFLPLVASGKCLRYIVIILLFYRPARLWFG